MTAQDAFATLRHYAPRITPISDRQVYLNALSVLEESHERRSRRLAAGWGAAVARDKARAIRAEGRAEAAEAENQRLTERLHRWAEDESDPNLAYFARALLAGSPPTEGEQG